MNMRKLVVGLVATFAFAAQVSAEFIDITGGFNVLTFGDFSSYNDQTWGTLGASGNVEIKDSYSIGTAWANTGNYPENAIVAGGSVSLTGSGAVWGGISAGSSVAVSQSQTVHGVINSNTDIGSVFNFAGAKAQLSQISNQIAAEDAIAAEVKWNGVFFTGSNLDLNYFTVDASDLLGATYFQFDIAKGSKAVINVTGETVDLVPGESGVFGVNGLGSDQGKSYAGNILWNFADATSLTVGGNIGTILALKAEVEMVGGEIWGDLITGSVSGRSEIHLAHYNGDFHTVPEAPSIALILVGMLGLLVVSKKRSAYSK